MEWKKGRESWEQDPIPDKAKNAVFTCKHALISGLASTLHHAETGIMKAATSSASKSKSYRFLLQVNVSQRWIHCSR